jgi:hypothetical protein
MAKIWDLSLKTSWGVAKRRQRAKRLKIRQKRGFLVEVRSRRDPAYSVLCASSVGAWSTGYGLHDLPKVSCNRSYRPDGPWLAEAGLIRYLCARFTCDIVRSRAEVYAKTSVSAGR